MEKIECIAESDRNEVGMKLDGLERVSQTSRKLKLCDRNVEERLKAMKRTKLVCQIKIAKH